MSEPEQPDPDLALKRYDALFRYLAYENTVYWTRSQFFLFANVGLLAVAAAKFPTSRTALTPAGMFVSATPIMFGFLLAVLWLIILHKAEIWIARWERLCRDLEPLAFGELEVWRNPPETRLKLIAHIVAYLFFALWLAAGAWLLRIATSN